MPSGDKRLRTRAGRLLSRADIRKAVSVRLIPLHPFDRHRHVDDEGLRIVPGPLANYIHMGPPTLSSLSAATAQDAHSFAAQRDRRHRLRIGERSARRSRRRISRRSGLDARRRRRSAAALRESAGRPTSALASGVGGSCVAFDTMTSRCGPTFKGVRRESRLAAASRRRRRCRPRRAPSGWNPRTSRRSAAPPWPACRR